MLETPTQRCYTFASQAFTAFHRQEASCMHLLQHHRVRPIITFQTNLSSFPLKKSDVISRKKLWIKSLWGYPSCTSSFKENLVTNLYSYDLKSFYASYYVRTYWILTYPGLQALFAAIFLSTISHCHNNVLMVEPKGLYSFEFMYPFRFPLHERQWSIT